MGIFQKTENKNYHMISNSTGYIFLKNANKPLTQKDTVLIAALFTIAKIWKQPKYTATDEQIKKV